MRNCSRLALVLAIGFAGPAAAQSVTSVTTKQTFKPISNDAPAAISTSPQAIVAPAPKTGTVITPPHIVAPIGSAGSGGVAAPPQPLGSGYWTASGDKASGIQTMPNGQKIGIQAPIGGVASVPPTASAGSNQVMTGADGTLRTVDGQVKGVGAGFASNGARTGGVYNGGIQTMPDGQKIGVGAGIAPNGARTGGVYQGGVGNTPDPLPPTKTGVVPPGPDPLPTAKTSGPKTGGPDPLPAIKTGGPIDNGGYCLNSINRNSPACGGTALPPIKTTIGTVDLPPQTNTLPVQPGGKVVDIGVIKSAPDTNWMPPSASVTPGANTPGTGGTVTPSNPTRPVDNGIAMPVPKNLLPDTQPITYGGGVGMAVPKELLPDTQPVTVGTNIPYSMPVESHPITATVNPDGTVTIQGY